MFRYLKQTMKKIMNFTLVKRLFALNDDSLFMNEIKNIKF